MANSVNIHYILLFFIVTMAASTTLDADMASNPAPLLAPHASQTGVNCMSLIYDMVDCMSYMSVGSKDTKPDPECCSGLKTVLKTDANCMCEALKSSAQLGFNFDMKRAIALPSACNTNASLDSCYANPPATGPAPSSLETSVPAPQMSRMSQKSPAPAPQVVPVSQKSPTSVPLSSLTSPKSSIAVPPIFTSPVFFTIHHAPAPAPNAGAYSLIISPAVHFGMLVASLLYLFA